MVSSFFYIIQGEASAVPGVARGDELATVIVNIFLFKLYLTLLFRFGSNGLRAMTWICYFVPGVTARVTASQWVQILTSSNLLLLSSYWLDSWIFGRSQLCSTTQCSAGWWCIYLNQCHIVFAGKAFFFTCHYMTTLCQPSSFSAKASLSSGCLAFCLISPNLEVVWSCHFTPSVWWISKHLSELGRGWPHESGLIWISCYFFHQDLVATHVWPQLVAVIQCKNISYFWK